MKKFLSLFICVMILASMLVFPASAAENEISVTPAANVVQVDSTVTVTIALSDTANVTVDQLEITLSHSRNYFETVSGKYLREDPNATVVIDNGKATITFRQPTAIRGKLCEFTLKGLQMHNLERTVRATVIGENGYSTVLDQTVETKIKVICKQHSFSHWSIDKVAECETEGEQNRKCSLCETVETQKIPATGHKFTDMELLRAATCTEIGYERGFCSNCSQKLLQQIPATGHSMGEWTTVKKPECVKKGLDQKKCKNCTLTESRDTEPIGHDFLEAVITTEPTLSTNGIKTGFCTRCSDTTTAEVPCAHVDKATGMRFDTKYGVFPVGTKMTIGTINSGAEGYEFIRDSLAHITNRFVGYSIITTLDNTEVHPKGAVTITFVVPAKYGKSASFYYINDNGSVKKLSATFNEDGTKATVKLVNTGYYAICKTGFDAGVANHTLFDDITLKDIITYSSIALVICWSLVILRIIKMKKPAFYKKITPKLPKATLVRNAIRRGLFVTKENIKKTFKKLRK